MGNVYRHRTTQNLPGSNEIQFAQRRLHVSLQRRERRRLGVLSHRRFAVPTRLDFEFPRADLCSTTSIVWGDADVFFSTWSSKRLSRDPTTGLATRAHAVLVGANPERRPEENHDIFINLGDEVPENKAAEVQRKVPVISRARAPPFAMSSALVDDPVSSRDAGRDASSLDASVLTTNHHASFIRRSSEDRDTVEFVLTEHLRMSGVYWGLTALDLLGRLDVMEIEPILNWLQQCKQTNGGYGGGVGHDAHVLYTLSAVQICCLLDRLDLIDADQVAKYCASLQNKKDGSFSGDEWGERDTRFSYCALACCALLGKLESIDHQLAAEYIIKCKNFDGGFGCEPGGESHAGQVRV